MIKFMQELLLEIYRGDITAMDFDRAVCTKDCPHRDDDRFCNVECVVTDEETVNAFLKKRLANYNGYDESMNDLLRECGFED